MTGFDGDAEQYALMNMELAQDQREALVARVTRTEGTADAASAVLNCQLALAWCLLRWSLPCGDKIQKLPSFSMTGATRLQLTEVKWVTFQMGKRQFPF
jgi:hypothetical protein